MGNEFSESSVDPGINDILEEIISCRLPMAERGVFLEARIKDLLRFYVRGQAIEEKKFLEVECRAVRVLKRIENYIEENLDKDLSVNSLAAVGGISRSWLQRISLQYRFKAIHEVVIEKRMDAASRLLADTDEPVGSIVVKVSLMTFAAFSSAFKKYAGVPPVQYRRKHR